MTSIISDDVFEEVLQKYEEGMDTVFVGRRGLSEFRIEHHGPIKNNKFRLYGMDVIYCHSIKNIVLINTSSLGTIKVTL